MVIMIVQTILHATECPECGITYGLPSVFVSARKGDHRTFWCPSGHRQHFPGESEVEQLNRQLEAARSLAKREAGRRVTAERSAAAQRGQVTKIKNRIANGVCPCCKRSFQDLRQHMAGQHPEFKADES